MSMKLEFVGVVFVDFVIVVSDDRFGFCSFEIDHSHSPFDSVGSVGRIGHSEFEQVELVDELLHVWIVLLVFIKDELSDAVEWFQICLNTSGLVGFFTFVWPNEDVSLSFLALV